MHYTGGGGVVTDDDTWMEGEEVLLPLAWV